MDATQLLRDVAQLLAALVEGVGVVIVAVAVLLASTRYVQAAAETRQEPAPPWRR